MSERERGKKKEEEEEKSPEKTLCRDRDLNPRTLSPEPVLTCLWQAHLVIKKTSFTFWLQSIERC